MKFHNKSFPNESEAYRIARDELLDEEIKLRSMLAKVTVKRQMLPLGGIVKENYVFEELGNNGLQSVRFSELFAAGKPSLIVYSYMYGPNMEQPCPACTSIIDGLSGNFQHFTDKVNFAVVAKSAITKVDEFAEQRNWNGIRLLSSAHNSYNADYFAQTDEGQQIPALNVFVKRETGIHHFYNAELLYAQLEGHPRHVDLLWPVWAMFDLTPEGRGDWGPKLNY